MLRVELKRVLKTRSTWRLAAIALVICLVSAFSTVRQVVKYIDHGDEPTEIVKGVDVYEENRERYSVIRGEVTPELFASVVALHHELLARYGTDYDIPPDISSEVLGAIFAGVHVDILCVFRRLRCGSDLRRHIAGARAKLLSGAAPHHGAGADREI